VTYSRSSRFDLYLVYTACGLLLVCDLFCGCAARRSSGASAPSASSGGNTVSREEAAASPARTPASSSGVRRKGDSTSGILPGAGYAEEGNASWYGIPFHGRHASNGEVYDMHKLTAAHRTLPFDTKVRVTNLTNGKSTIVRITDRGPFVEGRIIDLSMAAAQEIDAIGAGVVPVRIEVLSPIDPTAGFFTVQVGAFRDRANAERLRDRLSASYSPIFIQNYESANGLYYRVRVGKVPGEDAARQFGEQLRSREGFTSFIVRLDDSGPSGGSNER
jgi:rare lipoprotein A